ncbi:hypothetical protein [Citrobacter portucalensis]|uniref:hypothetical protein n=1 Tax=Citrobacter portucalensis TaxID=1639133 RepID=UPI00397995A7
MTPSVNQAVLIHIVQALKEGQIRYCESLGFSPQELCELTRLPDASLLHPAGARFSGTAQWW